MTEADRSGNWLLRSPAGLAIVIVMSLVLVVAGLHSAISGQFRLEQWRIPKSQIQWIPSSNSLLARFPTEGEATSRVSSLPFGDPSTVQIFHRFKRPTVGTAPLAVLTPAVDGQVELFVNFAPVQESLVPSAPELLRPAMRSRLWEIPQDYLHNGENRIDLVVSGTTTRSLAAPIYFGPKTELGAAINGGSNAIIFARQLVLALSLLALVVNLIASSVRAPARHLAIAAAFAASATRIFLAEIGREYFGVVWLVADPLLLAGMAICAGLAFREGALTSRWARSGEMALLLAGTALGAATLMAEVNGAQGRAFWGGTLCTLIGLNYLLLAMAGAVPRVNAMAARHQIPAGSVAGLCLFSALIAAVGVSGMIVPGLPYGLEIGFAAALSALALLAIGWGLIAFVQTVQVRLDQAQTIRRQQAELKATSFALEEKTRQTALLEERQRMARDVHDGIGGQLASLIAQVRMRRISMDHVEKALVGGLSELRFLVSSLDVIDASLADALATFLDRAQQQVSAAGIVLEWNQTSKLAAEIREPQWILNLYRLLQEAVTNAVRHSGGNRITISISDRDGGIIAARIADNGDGFDQEKVKRGRGLANMERRARDLGGTFSIEPTEGGQGVSILIEAQAPR